MVRTINAILQQLACIRRLLHFMIRVSADSCDVLSIYDVQNGGNRRRLARGSAEIMRALQRYFATRQNLAQNRKSIVCEWLKGRFSIWVRQAEVPIRRRFGPMTGEIQ
jgi:hypothetical protein